MGVIPKPGDKVRRNRPFDKRKFGPHHGEVYTVKHVKIWHRKTLDVDVKLKECEGIWMIKYFELVDSNKEKEFEELWV